MTAAFPLFFALGLVAGRLHFTAIARTASRIVRTGGSATTNYAARSVPTLVSFWAASVHGWPALLVTTTGLLVARAMLLRQLGPQA